MNILFIDDTEQMNGQYVGIGGVILRDSCLSSLFSLFNQKKALYGIPAGTEIKWSPSKNNWIAKNLIGDRRVEAYSDLLRLIRLMNGKIIVAVFRNDNPNVDSGAAKWKCIEFVTERFQFYLQADSDKNGLIIADFPGSGREEKKLLQDYYRLLEKGTKYVKPTNIVMNLLTTESHLNPALQIADLIVGATTGICTAHRDSALPYWDSIKHNLHRSQNGEVMGCGLKVFPSEMVADIYAALFPEKIEEEEHSGQTYEEYIEEMRYLYSVLMDEDELDMHFPRP